MSIELRILSGSRAGQTESFEKSVIAIGRHPTSDLRFDAQHDLDVSTKHGEIRGIDGRYTVHDNESTNGTFVNGERVPRGGARELRSGDVIGFGAHGPTVSVRIADSRTTPIGERATAVVETPPLGVAAQPAAAPRRPTQERVAIAVAEQTRGLKIAVGAAIVVLGGLAAGAYWIGHREAAASDAKLAAMMTAYENSSKELQTKLQGTNDTALVNGLQRERDSLIKLARAAKGSDAVVVQQSLQRHEEHARALTDMGPEAVSRANNAAIALIRADIGGKTWEATGFGVSANGQVVTNRHVVELDGARATRILVKFADTDTWKRARLVKVPDNADVDLALVQIEEPGTYPTVSGVASAVNLDAGAPIVSIGFPEGSDLPMEGAKATTTLMAGIVSKSVADVLQIDSYASHGSSGSPVFNSRGQVVGVIYGGPKDAGGKIVFAVPAPRVAELLGR